MVAFITKIFGLFTGWLNKYITAIRWGVLILSWIGIAWSVHHIDGLSIKAAQSDHVNNIAQAAPKIVTVTQTITKVIHDAKDPCAATAMPDTVLEQLRH